MNLLKGAPKIWHSFEALSILCGAFLPSLNLTESKIRKKNKNINPSFNDFYLK